MTSINKKSRKHFKSNNLKNKSKKQNNKNSFSKKRNNKNSFSRKSLKKSLRKKFIGGENNTENNNLFVLQFKKNNEKKKSFMSLPTFNFAEETEGWHNLKEAIRNLPHNKDINKHGEMTALKINDTSGHVKLNIFANNLANAIILQFSNLYFKSNGKTHEYIMKFKDIIINNKKSNNDVNNLYLPLPITIPTLSINDLLHTDKTHDTQSEQTTQTNIQSGGEEQQDTIVVSNTLKCENIIPKDQVEHLDNSIKNKGKDEIKNALNEITFTYDFKRKVWTTNLSNVYNLIGISFDNNNECDIDPTIPFWDTNDSNWDNVNKNKIGIQGISIEIIQH